MARMGNGACMNKSSYSQLVLVYTYICPFVHPPSLSPSLPLFAEPSPLGDPKPVVDKVPTSTTITVEFNLPPDLEDIRLVYDNHMYM